MKRRAYLATVASGGAVLTAGCFGGGEVVVDVTRSVRVEAGRGWTQKIPDVSDPGGAISYIVKSDDGPFDVYFFTERAAYEAYLTFVTGGQPSRTPAGDDDIGMASIPRESSVYVAQTADGGARQSIDATGPYWFVVDHSSYRMENPVDEYADPLAASVDVTVVRETVGLL